MGALLLIPRLFCNKSKQKSYFEFEKLNPVASLLDRYRWCCEPHRQKHPPFECIFTHKEHAIVNNKAYNNHLQTKTECFMKKLSLNSVLQ